MINPTSRFVLTNTIYFKGAWSNVFEKSATSNQDFKVNPNKSIKVQMMRQTDWFNYAETDDLQVLELPYKGQKLSMVILLPKSDDLKSVENQLSSEKLGQLRGNLSTKRVDISIPKFKFTTSYILNDNLQEIGMSSAFSGNADFSGITGDRNLFIGTAIHKAYIDVNEEGTEAAAATGIGMVGTSMPHQEPPPIIFRADHPFIFLIQETQTGNILFMGRVANPAES
jgi:serpin B